MWIGLALGCAPAPTSSPTTGGIPRADVVGVDVTGEPQAYTFAVTVRSDETGCEQYADWWEVLTPDGSLVYRRVLTHSHPSEQPFTRTGGPVPLAADDEVVVRAHLHPAGFTGAALRGSVADGFAEWAAPEGFAAGLASEPPLPESCLF